MRLCELRAREVVNVKDCKRIGYIGDLVFDEETGQIESVVIPGSGKLGGLLGVNHEYVIPFHCIKKIGPDIVLIEIQEEDFFHEI